MKLLLISTVFLSIFAAYIPLGNSQVHWSNAGLSPAIIRYAANYANPSNGASSAYGYGSGIQGGSKWASQPNYAGSSIIAGYAVPSISAGYAGRSIAGGYANPLSSANYATPLQRYLSSARANALASSSNGIQNASPNLANLANAAYIDPSADADF